MTPKEFWLAAAEWGSFNNSGDPGACLYGFDEKGLVRSEDHRRDCIEHINGECRKAAAANGAAGEDEVEQNSQLDALLEYLAAAPVAGAMPELDEFTQGYIQAALYTSADSSSDSDASLSDAYGPEHIEKDTLTRMMADCALFQEYYGRLFSGSESQAGHDFWLTRCGHGAGFWDGDWDEDIGGVLTTASKSFGNVDLLVGDDGRIHAMGGGERPSPVTFDDPLNGRKPS
jgi:hypothetical protein